MADVLRITGPTCHITHQSITNAPLTKQRAASHHTSFPPTGDRLSGLATAAAYRPQKAPSVATSFIVHHKRAQFRILTLRSAFHETHHQASRPPCERSLLSATSYSYIERRAQSSEDAAASRPWRKPDPSHRVLARARHFPCPNLARKL
ncbi:hypothetical protein EVG20_g2265 [Dentipellis fragilis]|uniref:Uncharacterized protein n=1 Tax=Dentipellis fragilis TaxID=205917 RepID=A0A4Y9Z7J9_9AGAM|nr:hypothetical protein EVG20_g2265 [Dentipellis fragilis]